MKIVHHNDNDGKLGAYIVKTMCEVDNYPIKFIEMDYSKTFPIDTILPSERVVIVDFSIEPEEMRKLLNITEDIIWIDHHKTAIEKYVGFEYEIPGLRYDGIAGCMLAYCYFDIHLNLKRCISQFKYKLLNGSPLFDNEEAKKLCTKEAPLGLKYVAAYDVWDFAEYGEQTIKSFQKGLYINNTRPEADDNIWATIMTTGDNANHIIDKILAEGKLLISYDERNDNSLCNHYGFESIFFGYRAFCLNTDRKTSDTFKSLNGEDYDLYIAFNYDGNEKCYKYSLRSGFSERSKKVDVSELAARFVYKGRRGGGHKYAAGFTLTNNVLEDF